MATRKPKQKRKRGQNKTATPATVPGASEQTFDFLGLPAEIRNKIYEVVIGDYPVAHLSRNASRKNLATRCPLIRIDRQIHQEFLDTVIVSAPVIEASAMMFRFGHIIAFLNRLSEHEAADLKKRTINIKLCFKVHDFRPADLSELERWLARVEKSDKKGAQVAFHYTSMAADPEEYLPPYGVIPTEVLARGKEGSRRKEESDKVKVVLEKNSKTPLTYERSMIAAWYRESTSEKRWPW